MRMRSRRNRINTIDDSVESRISANRHVGAAEIIVDRADDADNVEFLVRRFLLDCDFVQTVELFHEGSPFLSQFVRASEGTVAADDAQMGDRPFD